MRDLTLDLALGGSSRELTNGEVIYTCPFCRRKGHLYVNYRNNKFLCHGCRVVRGGDLTLLYQRLGIKRSYTPKVNMDLDELRSMAQGRKIAPVVAMSNDAPEVELPKGFQSILEHPNSDAYKYLKLRGVSDDDLEYYDIGICESDMFSRIYFPDFKEGKIWFWTSRSYMAHDSSPRYLFSPGSRKSERIYNLYRALAYCDDHGYDEIFVAEGPISAWALGKAGVATFGKDFSEKQVEILISTGLNITVVYDSDAHRSTFDLCKKIRSMGHTSSYVLLKSHQSRKVDPALMKFSGLLDNYILSNRTVYSDREEWLHRLSPRGRSYHG